MKNKNDISLNYIKSKNNQIFKYILPKNIFFNFLNIIKKYSDNKNIYKNKILIDKIIYKKLEFNNEIQNLIDNIKPYYNENKIFYINRKINYKNFLTIIRQLCKICNISYENKIKYYNSKYEIFYLINIHQVKDVCK